MIQETQPRSKLTVSLFIVAGVRVFRDALAEMLARCDKGFEVVGLAVDYEDALPQVRRLRPDVILVDVTQASVVESLRAIDQGVPGAKVVALAVRGLESEVVGLVEAGIVGYVARDAGLSQLVACIQSVMRGEALLEPRMTAAVLRRLAVLAANGRSDSSDDCRLTYRELDIADLIRRGRSNKEIACALSIEVSTVKNHVHHILDKLDVRTRTEAAARLAPLLALRQLDVTPTQVVND